MSWNKVPIKTICKGIYDGPHATPPESSSGAVFLGIPNFINGQLDLSNIRYISEQDLPKWTKRVTPQPNDIVFSYEATLNLYAIIPKGFWGCLGRRMALIRVDEKKADYKFLYYYFYSPAWRSVIQEHTVTGATVDRIPLVSFPDFLVELPDLPTQRRIASILSAYDDLIENNRCQIKLLEEAAQRLYREWFVELRFPGHEGVKVVDGVPEGWTVTTASEVTNVLRRGISPNYDETARLSVISQKCIRQYMVDMNQVRHQSKSFDSSIGLLDSDTVICSTGTGTLGRVGKVFGNHPNCTFDSHVTLVRTNGTIGKHYLNLKMYELQEYFDSCKTGSTNQTELSRSIVQNVKVYIADSHTQQVFEKIEEAYHQKMMICQHQIQLLTETRDRLLPKLMNGEMGI